MSKTNLADRLLKKSEKIIFKDKIGLVLSGGGARGAYQIGVWKSLKDCGVEIGGVYGTSIGALNSMAIAMDKYEDARDLWLQIDFDSVVRESAGDSFISKVFAALKIGGFDMKPLRESFNEFLEEEAVRESEVDVGLVTYSLTNLEPEYLYIKDIPEGELADYVLASANHPVFKRKKIDSEKFIDGGMYRNIPVNMALDKNFKEIVVVDLGPKRLKDIFSLASLKRSEEVLQVVISPREFYGDILAFDPEIASNYMREGYLDGLKALGFLKGEKYYIHANEDVFGRTLLSLPKVKKAKVLKIFELEPWQSESLYQFYYGQLLPVLENFFSLSTPLETALALLEDLAAVAGLEVLELYSIRSLVDKLVDCDEEKFKDRYYNDIPVSTLLKLLRFLKENTDWEKLESDEYSTFRKSFEEFSLPEKVN